MTVGFNSTRPTALHLVASSCHGNGPWAVRGPAPFRPSLWTWTWSKITKKRSCTIAASPAAFVLCLISFNKQPRFKQPSRSLLYLSTQLATTFMIFNDFFGGSSHLAPTNFRTRHVCAHPLLTKLDRFVDKHAKPVAHIHTPYPMASVLLKNENEKSFPMAGWVKIMQRSVKEKDSRETVQEAYKHVYEHVYVQQNRRFNWQRSQTFFCHGSILNLA